MGLTNLPAMALPNLPITDTIMAGQASRNPPPHSSRRVRRVKLRKARAAEITRERTRALEQFAALKASGLSNREAVQCVGVPRVTLWRWHRRAAAEGRPAIRFSPGRRSYVHTFKLGNDTGGAVAALSFQRNCSIFDAWVFYADGNPDCPAALRNVIVGAQRGNRPLPKSLLRLAFERVPDFQI